MIGLIVHRIIETNSTNNYAVTEMLTKRLSEGTVIVADSQIDGKGQGTNKWESEPGKNLTFSIVLYPDFLEVSRQFKLSKAISLGVADFLSRFTDGVTIKWPNDIYIGNRKVAGILIENSIRLNKISTCIAGIGLNVNQQVFVSDAPNPVSLSQITGKDYDLRDILTGVCLNIDARYQMLLSGAFSQSDEDYAGALYLQGIWATYSDEKGEFEGRILGVDQIGRLQIETGSGKVNCYHFKEVEFRR